MISKPIQDRFFKKVKKTKRCWFWTGLKTVTGYGDFWIEGGMRRAHRVSYQIAIGEIPAGLQIDHLCRVRHCVNPKHLEAVTQTQNTLRGYGFGAINKRKTACPKGHKYDVIKFKKGQRFRACSICNRVHSKKHSEKYRSKPENREKILAHRARLIAERDAERKVVAASRPVVEETSAIMPPSIGSMEKLRDALAELDRVRGDNGSSASK